LGKLRTVLQTNPKKLILPLIAKADQFVTAVVTAFDRFDDVASETIIDAALSSGVENILENVL
jgi:hypothetical protein